MKKVLIVGFLWPYINGSKRIIGLARHLAKFGWDPVVMTAPIEGRLNEEFQIIQTKHVGLFGEWVKHIGFKTDCDISYQLSEKVAGCSPAFRGVMRSGYNVYRELFAYPDEHKRWKKYAISSAKELIAKEKIDAVISVWPLTSHLIAKELKKVHGIPWLADLADLWSDNSAYQYSKIRRYFDKRLEVRTLACASELTTSTWPLTERLSAIHGGRKVNSIIIGYDDKIAQSGSQKLTEKFTITYTGMFYKGKREPDKFLYALREMLDEGAISTEDLDVRFYGPKRDDVENLLEQLKLSNAVKQYGTVSLQECHARQAESQLLLHINWSDAKEKGVFSGKFLDYLAARRPILAAGGAGKDEVIKDILLKTNAGRYASEHEVIRRTLGAYYRQYKSDGAVPYSGIESEVRKFSNDAMAKQFADILNRMTMKI